MSRELKPYMIALVILGVLLLGVIGLFVFFSPARFPGPLAEADDTPGGAPTASSALPPEEAVAIQPESMTVMEKVKKAVMGLMEAGDQSGSGVQISQTTAEPIARSASIAPAGGAGLTDPNRALRPAPLNFRGKLPKARTPFTDPTFGTTLMRFTDATDKGDYANHDYSQLQAFSRDNKYILVNEEGGSTVRYLDTGEKTAMRPFIGNDVRWYPGANNQLIHYLNNNDGRLVARLTNVETGEGQDAFVFPVRFTRIRNNQSFDELSDDGRWMGGMAVTNDDDDMLFVVDLVNKKLGAQLSLQQLYRGTCERDPQYGVLEPDWVGASPLGKYLVVNWSRDGSERCSGQEIFDIQTGKYLGHSYDGRQHGDLAVTPDGKEVFVTTLSQSPVSNGLPALGYYELPNGLARPHFIRSVPWHGVWHISCRGPRGFCAVTSYDPEPEWDLKQVLDSEIYLIFFDGSVRRLTHHRSSGCGYWVQPRATISRDGQYIAFDSDYQAELGGRNSCERLNDDLGGGEVFLIILPAAALESPRNPAPFSGFEGEADRATVSDQAPATAGSEPVATAPAPLSANSRLGAKGPLPASTYTLKAGETISWDLADSPWHTRLSHTIGVAGDGDGCFDQDFVAYDVYLAPRGSNEFTLVGAHYGGEAGSFLSGHEVVAQGCNKGALLYVFAPGTYRAAVCITNDKNQSQRYCTPPLEVTAK